jgi:SagB-type dehydrogenase family enzyme
LYYYDPQSHCLQRIPAEDEGIMGLIRRARHAAQLKSDPDILLILTARFEHLMRKYESIAYSLILKNVGAVFQTMYLTATALALSPCAIGVGDAELFAATAGLNYFEESSVGEFILG